MIGHLFAMLDHNHFMSGNVNQSREHFVGDFFTTHMSYFKAVARNLYVDLVFVETPLSPKVL